LSDFLKSGQIAVGKSILFYKGINNIIQSYDPSDISDLKTSVSNGKSLIASAITDKGVSTASDATFQTMADNIGNISSMPDTGIALLCISALPGWTINYSGGSINKTFILENNETYRIVPVEVGYTYSITYSNNDNSITNYININKTDKFYNANMISYTYTGNSNYRSDGVIEFLTSGILTISAQYCIDVFLVGGGSGGCGGWYSSSSSYGGGGGGAGGYTKTSKSIEIIPGDYNIIIGAGGKAGSYNYNNSTYCAPMNGEDTIGFGLTANGGKISNKLNPGGTVSSLKLLICGGNGGSGGGQGMGRSITSEYFKIGGDGGSDGSDGKASDPKPNINTYPIGTGQGSTTREFSESSGKLYAGGGGGGVVNVGSSSVWGNGGEGGGGNYDNKNGTANSGGGGFGGNDGQRGGGGDGGSGIICIRLHK